MAELYYGNPLVDAGGYQNNVYADGKANIIVFILNCG